MILDIITGACYVYEHMHKTRGGKHVAEVQKAAKLQV